MGLETFAPLGSKKSHKGTSSMTQKTKKAQRSTFYLGTELELDCFLLPDGTQKMSQSQVCSAAKKPAKRMVELASSEKGQILIQSGFQKGLKVPVEGSKPVTMVSPLIAFQFWVLEAGIGNAEALALVLACGAESLERRIDNAFQIKRTEEERNIRFQTRMEGILSRNFWTDTVDAYLNSIDYPREMRWQVYATISDMVNLKVIGLRASCIKDYLMLPSNARTRDFLPTETLKLVDTIERAAAIRMAHNETVPTQALKDVINILGIEPDMKRLDN